MNSTHRAEVVSIKLEKHPEADTLSIVKVADYTVIVKTDEWKNETKGIYVCPDTILPNKPEYSWLENRRIKVRKFRGIYSQGLLLKAPEEANIGDDYFEKLGLVHYDPAEPRQSNNALRSRQYERHPDLSISVYDIDTGLKYARKCFEQGEPVWVTEKCHGSNFRAVYAKSKHKYRGLSLIDRVKRFFSKQEYELFLGSRKRWVRNDGDNAWSRVLLQYPGIGLLCRAYPNHIIYGEVFGSGIQNLTYGCSPGEIKFACFDLRKPDGLFMDPLDTFNLVESYGIPHVPVIDAALSFDFDKIKELASGDSLVSGAKNIREGVVFKPLKERFSEHLRGRLVLKIVSDAYLEKA